MTSLRRRLHVLFWRVVNPPTRPLAGVFPWWVLLESTGWRSHRLHRVPLARGPSEPDGMWLAAVHGRGAAWVKNIEHDPRVRVRLRRQWREGTAEVHPFAADVAARFNRYARSGPRLLGVDPRLVFVRWHGEAAPGAQPRSR